MQNGFVTYENLDFWKEAGKLVALVHSKSKNFPKTEQYGLTNQIELYKKLINGFINHYKKSLSQKLNT